jgi:hypothetical protein
MLWRTERQSTEAGRMLAEGQDNMTAQVQQIAERVYLLSTLKEATGFSSRHTIVKLLQPLNDTQLLEVAEYVAQKRGAHVSR